MEISSEFSSRWHNIWVSPTSIVFSSAKSTEAEAAAWWLKHQVLSVVVAICSLLLFCCCLFLFFESNEYSESDSFQGTFWNWENWVPIWSCKELISWTQRSGFRNEEWPCDYGEGRDCFKLTPLPWLVSRPTRFSGFILGFFFHSLEPKRHMNKRDCQCHSVSGSQKGSFTQSIKGGLVNSRPVTHK